MIMTLILLDFGVLNAASFNMFDNCIDPKLSLVPFTKGTQTY